MADSYDLVIIGAGNLGLWTAYHLGKNGFGRIAVCERNWAGSGTTTRAGWSASIDFTPDHLPIIDEPEPGMYVLAAGGHGMMWGPGLGFKMAELIYRGEVSELPLSEIAMKRFSEPLQAKGAIALPFPTTLTK